MKIIWSSVLALSSVMAHANIDQKYAENFLLHQPPKAFNQAVPAQYKNIEALTKPMFSNTASVRHGEGYRNYLLVKAWADTMNPYAAYNAGMYQMMNKEKYNFDYGSSLLYLKLGADGGVLDSKYALALIYMNRTDEVARAINGVTQTVSQAELLRETKRNASQLRTLSQQYILDLASKGHEKAYMMACNYYTRGEYLEQSIVHAALCYNNAIKVFNSSIARGLLAKMYFDAPEFNTADFERKGIELSKEAMTQGNMYAMVNLGIQLINPKHVPKTDVDIGVKLIQNAATAGDEAAIKYVAQHFDDEGHLMRH